MNARRLGMAALLAISLMVAYRSGSAAQAKNDDQESLALRAARAQLRFAERTLQSAEAMNKKVPLTFADSTIELFANEVEVAKACAESLEKTDKPEPLQACLDRQEIAVRMAESKLKKATETNRRAAGVVPPIDLERLRLGVEVAKLQLELGRSLTSAPAEQKLQYQLDMFNAELERVRQETYLLGQNRPSRF